MTMCSSHDVIIKVTYLINVDYRVEIYNCSLVEKSQSQSQIATGDKARINVRFD